MEKNESGGQSFFEKFGTPLAVVAGALIIGGAFMFGQGGDRANTPGGAGPVAVDINEVNVDTSPFVGARNAEVTMAVWFDFQCRFCKQFETTTLKEVIATYGDSVRIVYKDFQFLGAASNDSALYSRAVWDAYPDQWGEWFAAVFEIEGEGTPTTAELDTLSAGLGFDTGRLADLRSSKSAEYQAAIDADREEGMQFGVNGTPGTIIGTELLAGAQSFAAVQALIDAQRN